MPIQWFVKCNPGWGVTVGIWQDAQALAGGWRQIADGGAVSAWHCRQLPSYFANPRVKGAWGSWQFAQSSVRPLPR